MIYLKLDGVRVPVAAWGWHKGHPTFFAICTGAGVISWEVLNIKRINDNNRRR